MGSLARMAMYVSFCRGKHLGQMTAIQGGSAPPALGNNTGAQPAVRVPRPATLLAAFDRLRHGSARQPTTSSLPTKKRRRGAHAKRLFQQAHSQVGVAEARPLVTVVNDFRALRTDVTAHLGPDQGVPRALAQTRENALRKQRKPRVLWSTAFTETTE
ncbi:uncharacterized protein UV8b_00199 [Ustilaginoidea virens]|uniref:Uncharacterized protein n=1 Tax=Ustilaginoidea virens TaxID=1159556 RepID=A0A8E5HIC5_USTVR|nr:uncharacterized protein UV8b_00199 [Ustilaginoidea virens]QUC15958.1 hypothetical protein UV8b_00199 [Ustilaginoidea virens]